MSSSPVLVLKDIPVLLAPLSEDKIPNLRLRKYLSRFNYTEIDEPKVLSSLSNSLSSRTGHKLTESLSNENKNFQRYPPVHNGKNAPQRLSVNGRYISLTTKKPPDLKFPSLPVIQPLQQKNRKLRGEARLNGSSSSPVMPIEPLLQLGGEY